MMYASEIFGAAHPPNTSIHKAIRRYETNKKDQNDHVVSGLWNYAILRQLYINTNGLRLYR